MAISWNYNPEEGKAKSTFKIPEEGDYEVQIVSAEEKTSHAGNPMIQMDLEFTNQDVYSRSFRYWLVFNDTSDAARKRTNKTLHDFWLAFGLPEGTLNVLQMITKTGVAHIKPEQNPNGYTDIKISWWVAKKQDKALDVTNDDLPF